MLKHAKAAASLSIVAALVAGLTILPGCQTQPPENNNTNTNSNNVNTTVSKNPNNGVQAMSVMTDTAAEVEGGMGYSLPADYYNTEEYNAINESGFISTAANPLSTVSADVDTASYCNLRRMINNGYVLESEEAHRKYLELQEIDVNELSGEELEDYYQKMDEYHQYGYDVIPEGAVRIEEMLNYFDYDYKNPTGQDKFSINASMSQCPWNDKTELLTLGFYAGDIKDKPAGRNLVFLIDVSGSMDNENKLPLLQDAFDELINQLDENDRISVVTYASGEEVILDGAKGNDTVNIVKAVNRLKAEGSTNGEAGLQKAYELAEKNFIENGTNRIIMASDGDLNVGMTSESDLETYVSKKRDSGIYLSVLGFGDGNYKDNKMETLADNGNGSYHYIDCIEEAERVFKDHITQNITPFANDVKVQVDFNPSQIKGYRLIGYENREMNDEDFKNEAKDAGDVGPGSQFTVCYEIVKADSDFEMPDTSSKYAAPSENSSDELFTATLRYKPIENGEVKESVEQELVVTSKIETDNPSDDWKFQAALIEGGMAMRHSEFAGTSNLDSAVQMLEEMKLDSKRAEYRDLLKKLKNN